MAAVESGGGFSQKRNTNSQVGLSFTRTVDFSQSWPGLFSLLVELARRRYSGPVVYFSPEHMSPGWGLGR